MKRYKLNRVDCQWICPLQLDYFADFKEIRQHIESFRIWQRGLSRKEKKKNWMSREKSFILNYLDGNLPIVYYQSIT